MRIKGVSCRSYNKSTRYEIVRKCNFLTILKFFLAPIYSNKVFYATLFLCERGIHFQTFIVIHKIDANLMDLMINYNIIIYLILLKTYILY